MADTDTAHRGPDLANGVPVAQVPTTGVLVGHVEGDTVLVARLDDGFHALSGTCTHYGGPLADGLVAGDEIRCSWHHACFSLRTGVALRAPAFTALTKWNVEIIDNTLFVRSKIAAAAGIVHHSSQPARAHPDHRWRRRRICRRRTTSRAGLCRRLVDAQRRFLGAL